MHKTIRIGYVPYCKQLTHPDDRRRFPFFARRNKIRFEIAKPHVQYDIILLPAPANLSKWLLYKRKHPQTKFIFEMVDSLIYQSDLFNTLFKGVGRFILRKEDLPTISHKSLLLKWLSIADVVLCSSDKIREDLLPVNKNTFVSLDYLEHEYHFLKNDYTIRGKMKLLWEGQGVILPHLLHFKKALSRISSFCELHVVTSETFPAYGQFVKKNVPEFLKQLPIDTHFHPWDLHKNPALFSKMDCGVIPLDRNNAYAWHKPANKLLSFWFSGLPVLTSDTPAYERVAIESGGNFLCRSENEWVEEITRLYEMPAFEREVMAEENFDFVRNHYSNQALDHVWNTVFEKLAGYDLERISRATSQFPPKESIAIHG